MPLSPVNPSRILPLSALTLLAALAAAAPAGGQATPASRQPAGAPAPLELAPGDADAAEIEPTGVHGAGPERVYQIRMSASYEPESRLIAGNQRLRWRNTSSVPVDTLCFHHYLNAFASNRSTFFRESGGRLRGDVFPGQRWGWTEVSSMRLPDGTDLKQVESFVRPEDGNPHDRTVAVYPLPEPLPPGGWITVEIDFESRLPAVFARTGAEGDYVLGGQWFPKISVFEDRGEGGRDEPGWNCHQFHAHSEFFADFGDYDVTLELPARYRGKVGATGALVEEAVEGDRLRVRFVQRGVHDFAWTGDPRYRVIRETFDPARDVPAGRRERIAALLERSPEELVLHPVEITLLLQPAHTDQAGRYLAAAKAALVGLGLRLGAYPYPTLTLVDPPLGAEGSRGMEYPTFITLGTHPLLEIPPFRGVNFPEVVTIHELAHQYFQGMVASNEFEESWLDEGITSYYEMVVMEEEEIDPVELLGLRLSPYEVNYRALAAIPLSDPVTTPSWGFLSGASYSLNSYSRPTVTLRHLENLLGPGPFHRIMRRFFETFQWHHPTTEDFEATFQEATGGGVDWLLEQALRTTRTLDYAVRSVESAPLPEPEGVLWEAGQRREPVEPDEPSWLARWLPGPGDGEAEGPFRSEAVVYRRGELIHPVTVEFRFEGGGRLNRTWDGERRWVRWTFTGPHRLETVVVDPEGVLALDVDRLNNSRHLEPEPLPHRKLLVDLLFMLQSLFRLGGLLA